MHKGGGEVVAGSAGVAGAAFGRDVQAKGKTKNAMRGMEREEEGGSDGLARLGTADHHHHHRQARPEGCVRGQGAWGVVVGCLWGRGDSTKKERGEATLKTHTTVHHTERERASP